MKKLTFKTAVLCIVAVYAVTIAAGLVWFWNYLKRYEAEHPVGAMNAYFEALSQGDTDKILQDSDFTFDAYNTKDVYIQYLCERYMNGVGKWQYAAMGTDEQTGVERYDVYESDRKYGTLYLEKQESGYRVFSDWEKSHQTVLVSPLTPLVNGVEAGNAADTKAVAVFAGSKQTTPQTTKYTVDTLLPPTIGVPDGKAVLHEQQDGSVLVTAGVDEAKAASLKTFAQTAAETYALFISGDTERSNLTAMLESGSTFAAGVYAYDSKWYNKHNSAVFQNMQVKDPVNWGNGAYTVEVRFDFVVSRTYDTHTYPTAYTVALRETNGQYRVVNIAPL